MTAPSRLALAAVLLSLPALCAAQKGDAAVPRPDLKVGDRWVYMEKRSNEATPWAFELAVTFADDKAVHTVTTTQGGRRETDAIWTPEWNPIASAAGGIFDPKREVLRFPLRPGSAWKSVYELRLPKKGEYRAKWEWTVKVEGYEEIVVPAGKFRALKVVGDANVQRLDVPGAGTAREVHWYVGRVKRVVKYTFEEFSDRRRTYWQEEELVFYSVQ